MEVSPTTVVAWWGAVLSSIVFLWDVYKYRRAGPKLRMSVQAGMILMPSTDKRTFVVTEVINSGDRPTTLTNLGLAYFEKKWSWKRLRNRPTKVAVTVTPSPAQPFPWKLEAGALWRGMTEQTQQLETWARDGILYFDIFHSHDKKPIRRRVRIE